MFRRSFGRTSPEVTGPQAHYEPRAGSVSPSNAGTVTGADSTRFRTLVVIGTQWLGLP